MHVKYTLLVALALILGAYLLRDHREGFHPYRIGPSTDLLILSQRPQHGPLFDFVEAQVEAERLRDQADESFGKGAYDQAVAALLESIKTHSYIPEIYERLDLAYSLLGRWDLALAARDGGLLRESVVSFKRWDAPGVHALPAIIERTRDYGLENCRHEVVNSLDRVSPGVAVYDLDGNGYPDLICLGGPRRATRVYRGTPAGFVELTATGLEENLYSQGVYVIDVNHDRLPDVVVTAIGSTRLYLNQGNFQFVASSLPLPEMWASAVAAADFSGNGHVDLVVGGWIGQEVWIDISKPDPGGFSLGEEERALRSQPHPGAPHHLLNIATRYGVPLRLLEGDGQGGFTDITERTGVDVNATTLNLELIDVNADGHLDLMVINDAMPSRLFLGDGQGRFRDVTYPSRFADLRAGMGLAVADFFGSGQWDFIKTHFQGEMNGIFAHDGFDGDVPLYRDVALESGLGPPSLPYVSWAAFAWDFDADGAEDLLIMNGHLGENPQPMQLFQNQGLRFSNLSGALPPPINELLHARGAVLFDMNGNGHDDLLVVQNDAPARLFELLPRHDNHWLRVRVRTRDVDALGGAVELVDTQGVRRKRPVRTGSAYLSTQPRDYYFGLGKAWPKELTWRGRLRSFMCGDLQADRIVTITEEGCEQSLPAALP